MKKLVIYIKDSCHTCRLLENKMHAIKKELLNVEYEEINLDDPNAINDKNILSVPQLFLYNDEGSLIWKHKGAISYHDIRYNLEH